MSLINQLLHHADNALILGHRNSEWTGHGPILEQDIALSNIALDLIGQARNFYQYAAELIGKNATEDSLAYTRNANEFKNFLLVEQENGDWGKTILRQFFFSAYQYPLYQQMNEDERLKGIAEKSLKEVTYHLRWSSEWVIRLGQGTEESHRRMTNAINELWSFTGELLLPAIKDQWLSRVNEILSAAGIEIPANPTMISGGPEGHHTKYLEKLLNEMQYMQRTYPGVEW
ncbi:MAG: phenylacetate-CoA oxygenase subunit PaaC [Chitinophagaceae bacterium]|nr:phenylacetate-CoA oxygenase subunit PaaC [Chitinophagaceae bacterium]